MNTKAIFLPLALCFALSHAAYSKESGDAASGLEGFLPGSRAWVGAIASLTRAQVEELRCIAASIQLDDRESDSLLGKFDGAFARVEAFVSKAEDDLRMRLQLDPHESLSNSVFVISRGEESFKETWSAARAYYDTLTEWQATLQQVIEDAEGCIEILSRREGGRNHHELCLERCRGRMPRLRASVEEMKRICDLFAKESGQQDG